MDVLGKTKDGAAYRVAIGLDGKPPVELWVSDALLSSEYGRDARVSHTEAYEWIAANQHALADAARVLANGKTPRAPYDGLALAEES
ncbi:hypothetical protein [Rhodophyticola porphyridii]|uniref:DUF1488 family protein n=1 Tax=Rhodophyticola porphyridii TaxID=1852017 RepID=A0A3L9Y3R8_9RHOB|nr:hypothetical protein [Rhodophyticola porphyridii]RMA42105.1 hypothetical protein D9R08_11680 [Rhodophyticola porphyridii]